MISLSLDYALNVVHGFQLHEIDLGYELDMFASVCVRKLCQSLQFLLKRTRFP